MDSADSILLDEGLEIDESIDDPVQFLEALCQIVENEDKTLSDSTIEALLSIGELLHEALDEDLDEGDLEWLHKKHRRMQEIGQKGKRSLSSKHWTKNQPEDPLAVKDPGEVAVKAADKKKVVIFKKAAEPVSEPGKKAVGEEAEYSREQERDPGEFKKSSFRTITLGHKGGKLVKGIIGRPKGSKKMRLQAKLVEK
jgi:hypothetical protein